MIQPCTASIYVKGDKEMELEKIFEQISSEILTDEVKVQISTIFEAKLNEAIAAKEGEMEEQNRKEIAEFKESLIGQIDEYLNYFVEEYTRENEAAIEESVQLDTAKHVLSTFSDMVDKFNLELSEETIDNTAEVTALKDEVNAKVNENIELKKEIADLTRKGIVESKAAELTTDAEKEKFRKLAEGVTFEDEEGFGKKLDAIVETVKASTEKPAKIEESVETPAAPIEEQKPATSDKIKSYLERL